MNGGYARPAIRLLIIVAAIFLLITHLMEPTLQNFIALLSAVGLALGFALKDYVSSQIAGIVTLFEIPYRVGDWISIDGSHKLLCVADFYLHPRHDGETVRDALYDVALTSAYLNLGTPISVVAKGEPWGIHYRLKAYPIEPRDQFRFIIDLTLRGKAILLVHGVEFAISPGRNSGF
ncbi:mechanosensitive ion channel domain-containing protein [Methylomonas rapida]|uniref:Small-conductance mechanosensitive channel n=1 Tax=Methylomonas rapida TaxID=2963939 RepID=A0ABY7GKU0_9GAMM|nr:mechanosensitive ion channel domain-containing protein [Methylomonas rapida]WAR45107.1 mechanosensitive ion channel [Methylomonas rapida]